MVNRADTIDNGQSEAECVGLAVKAQPQAAHWSACCPSHSISISASRLRPFITSTSPPPPWPSNFPRLPSSFQVRLSPSTLTIPLMPPSDSDDDHDALPDQPRNRSILPRHPPPAVFDSRTSSRRRPSVQPSRLPATSNRLSTPHARWPPDAKKKLKQSKLPDNFGGSASVSYGLRRSSAGGTRLAGLPRTVSQERLLADTASRSAPTIQLVNEHMQKMKDILAADSLARQSNQALQRPISKPADSQCPQSGPSKPSRRPTDLAFPTAEDGPDEESRELAATEFPRTLLFHKKRAAPTNQSTRQAQEPTTRASPCQSPPAKRRAFQPDADEPKHRTRRHKPPHPTRNHRLTTDPDPPSPSHSSPASHATPARPVQEMVFPLGIDIDTQCSPLTYQLVHPPEKIRQLNRSHGGWLERKGDASEAEAEAVQRLAGDVNDSKSGARHAPAKNVDTNATFAGRVGRENLSRANTPDAQAHKKYHPLSPLASPTKSAPRTDLRHPQKTVGERLDGRDSVPVKTSVSAKIVGYQPATDVRIPSPSKSSTSTAEELSSTEYSSDDEPGSHPRQLCPNSSSSLARAPVHAPVQPGCFELGQESMLPQSQKPYAGSRMVFVEDLLLEGRAGVDMNMDGVQESMLPETQKLRTECRLLFDDELATPDQSSLVDAAGKGYDELAEHTLDGSDELGVNDEQGDVTVQAERCAEQRVVSTRGADQQAALTSSTPCRSRVLVEETQASPASSPCKTTAAILAQESQESPRRRAPGRSLAPPTPVPVRVRALEKFQSGAREIKGGRSSLGTSARSPHQAGSGSQALRPATRKEVSPGVSSATSKVVPSKRPALSITTRIQNAWTAAPEFRIPTAPTLRQVGIAQFCVPQGPSASVAGASRADAEAQPSRVRALAEAAEESLRRMTRGAESRGPVGGSEEEEIEDGESEVEIAGSEETDGRCGTGLEEMGSWKMARRQVRLGLAAQLGQQQAPLEAEEGLSSHAGGMDEVASRDVDPEGLAGYSLGETMGEDQQGGGGGQEEEDVDVCTQQLIEISEALLHHQQQQQQRDQQ